MATLAFDVVKIGRSLINDIDTGRGGEIVRTVIEMARTMGVTTVAEGVEAESDIERLRDLGSDLVQGYFIGRPMPAETVAERLGLVRRRVGSRSGGGMERDLGLEQILVPVDLGPHSETLFAHALRLCLNTGVPLTAVHVADNPDARFHWPAMAEPRDLLVRWGTLPEGATEADVAALGLHVDHDARVAWSPELGIMDVVIERLPNIIVVGTEARTGLERLRHGSVAEEVARRSGAVTLVIPDGHPGFVDVASGRVGLRGVVFPVGGDVADLQHAAEVLEAFLDIVGATAVEVVSLHVGDDPEPNVEFDSASGHIHTVEHRDGSVVSGITAAMEELDPDLLVMGTSGHDSIGDMLRGSTTERVLRHATCPVLIVPMG